MDRDEGPWMGAIGQGRHDQDDTFYIELIGLFIAWGGFWLGGILAWGDFVRGDFVRGGFVRGDFFRGDFVLSPRSKAGLARLWQTSIDIATSTIPTAWLPV